MTDWNGMEANHSVTTPNGYVIEYEAEPKRLYRIDGVEVPSVTQILKCLNKEALTWWGMKVGVSGMLQLLRTPAGVPMNDPYQLAQWLMTFDDRIKNPAVDAVIAKLTQHQLTTNHIKAAGGARGASVHDALERWAATGELPDPLEYPKTEQGYVIALIAFLNDVPSLTPDAAELMVGSKEHGFAGRYDLRGHTTQEHVVVTKVYPKAPSKTTRIPPGSGIWDLKTAVDVFPEHSLQLGGYEGASVECGHEPTDFRVVIQVGEDGRYQARRAKATLEDFLAIKACSEALQRAADEMKVAYR